MKYCFAFTDASFCPDTHTMGWAVIIKAGKERYIFSGGGVAKTPHRAEQYALSKAAELICLMVPPEKREVVLFRSDCLGALNKFSPVIPGSSVKKKHITAHSQKSIVSQVNKRCHDAALSEMRERREGGTFTNSENTQRNGKAKSSVRNC